MMCEIVSTGVRTYQGRSLVEVEVFQPWNSEATAAIRKGFDANSECWTLLLV